MSAVKISLPDGRIVRSQSQRRFVVIDASRTQPYIVRRSDALATAVAAAQKLNRRGVTFIADTAVPGAVKIRDAWDRAQWVSA